MSLCSTIFCYFCILANCIGWEKIVKHAKEENEQIHNKNP